MTTNKCVEFPEVPDEIKGKRIKDLSKEEKRVYNNYIQQRTKYFDAMDRVRANDDFIARRQKEAISQHFRERLSDSEDMGNDVWVKPTISALGDDAKRVLTLCASTGVIEDQISTLSGFSLRKVRSIIKSLFSADLLVIAFDNDSDEVNRLLYLTENDDNIRVFHDIIPDYPTTSDIDSYLVDLFGLAAHEKVFDILLFDENSQEEEYPTEAAVEP